MKRKLDFALYKKILVVALPITLQNLLDAAVNSADVLMLNDVGQDAISATSLATQYSSIIFMFLYGIGTGVSMLSAQYWGKKDTKAIEKVEGIGLKFSMSIAGIFALLCLIIPEYLMMVFTNDAALIHLGSIYLRIYAPAIVLWSSTSFYTAIMRCIGKVNNITDIEIIELLSND